MFIIQNYYGRICVAMICALCALHCTLSATFDRQPKLQLLHPIALPILGNPLADVGGLPSSLTLAQLRDASSCWLRDPHTPALPSQLALRCPQVRGGPPAGEEPVRRRAAGLAVGGGGCSSPDRHWCAAGW